MQFLAFNMQFLAFSYAIPHISYAIPHISLCQKQPLSVFKSGFFLRARTYARAGVNSTILILINFSIIDCPRSFLHLG